MWKYIILAKERDHMGNVHEYGDNIKMGLEEIWCEVVDLLYQIFREHLHKGNFSYILT
jgi:hypothetical protein